jgi:hypothetical protein
MAKFRKKPVVIEAVQWTGRRVAGDCPAWLSAALHLPGVPDTTPGAVMRIGDEVHIGTLEGVVRAQPGDWIIQGVKGELYPCRDDIFRMTYEGVTDAA